MTTRPVEPRADVSTLIAELRARETARLATVYQLPDSTTGVTFRNAYLRALDDVESALAANGDVDLPGWVERRADD